MDYQKLTLGKNQDQINEIYINWELRWNRILDKYFKISSSMFTKSKAQELSKELLNRMYHLAKYHNADSLPF